MAGIDIMGGLNKAFLATVGAVAITAVEGDGCRGALA